MRGKGVFKAGKLIKISLDYASGRIEAIKIHGDFFLYPEEAVSKLEQSLVGCALEKHELESKVSETLKSENIQVFGFDASQLAEAILLATKSEAL